ncbi:MAG: hypothetical protein IPJ16_08090 [Bacteroidales bacterium]|nr:hypothetical protein [Bacteroidales bacterium]
MVNKTYTQFGKFSVAVMLPIFILSLIMLVCIGFDELITVFTFGFVLLTLLICLLTFYKLTISVTDTYVSFSLGIGLVSRKYSVSDIKSCKPVKNNILTGVGIRMLNNGWLYNVSGLQAIELTFKNRKSVVRIGTDKPEEVAMEINKLIEGNKMESISDYNSKSHVALILIILFLAIIIPAAIVLSGKREIKTTFTNTEFVINGMYGMGIKLADIRQLDTISALPAIKRRTNGYAAGNTLKGNFTLSDKSKVKLFITKGNPPYISIRTDDLQLYFNFEDSRNTVELFNELKERVKR